MSKNKKKSKKQGASSKQKGVRWKELAVWEKKKLESFLENVEQKKKKNNFKEVKRVKARKKGRAKDNGNGSKKQPDHHTNVRDFLGRQATPQGTEGIKEKGGCDKLGTGRSKESKGKDTGKTSNN